MPGAALVRGRASSTTRRSLFRRAGADRPALLFQSERHPLAAVSWRGAGAVGRGRRGRPAAARRRSRRPGRGRRPEHPRGRRRAPRLRQHRRDLGELLARLRDAQPDRPLRPDLAEGPHRGRRLHVRWQAVRSTPRHRGDPRRAAVARGDRARPVPRRRRSRRAPGEMPWADLIAGPVEPLVVRARAVRPPAVGPLLVGDDRAAEGDRPRPRRHRPRAREGGRPALRRPPGRPDVLVHDDRLDDVEPPARLAARRWHAGPVRRQSRVTRPRRPVGAGGRGRGHPVRDERRVPVGAA